MKIVCSESCEEILFKDIKLESNTVHLWFVAYKDVYHQIKHISEIISDSERNRSEKYKFIKDKQYFIIRRGLLRILIGSYLSIHPGEVSIYVSDYGKPYIEHSNNGNLLNFNISHSYELILYGFTQNRPVGVDIEYIRPMQDIDTIIDSYFSPDEKSEFFSLPAEGRLRAFYHAWTQKEAFLKALGDGLSRGLDEFEVSMNPDRPSKLKSTKWDIDEAGRWTLKTLQILHDYSVSLAVKGHNMFFSCRELTPEILDSIIKKGNISERI